MKNIQVNMQTGLELNLAIISALETLNGPQVDNRYLWASLSTKDYASVLTLEYNGFDLSFQVTHEYKGAVVKRTYKGRTKTLREDAFAGSSVETVSLAIASYIQSEMKAAYKAYCAKELKNA